MRAASRPRPAETPVAFSGRDADRRPLAADEGAGNDGDVSTDSETTARSLPGYRPLSTDSIGAEDVREALPDQGRFGFGTGDVAGSLGRFEVIGQVFDGYIVCQGEGEVLLVDQHAAHECLLFAGLLASYRARGVERQPLLLPVPVTVGTDGVDAVENSADALERTGWEIDPFGVEDVVVRAVPALAAHVNVASLAEGVVADLVEFGAASGAERLIERVLATVACHSAVRVGTRLDRKAAIELVAEIASIETRASCPHGRPVARTLTRAAVETMFGR